MGSKAVQSEGTGGRCQPEVTRHPVGKEKAKAPGFSIRRPGAETLTATEPSFSGSPNAGSPKPKRRAVAVPEPPPVHDEYGITSTL